METVVWISKAEFIMEFWNVYLKCMFIYALWFKDVSSAFSECLEKVYDTEIALILIIINFKFRKNNFQFCQMIKI